MHIKFTENSSIFSRVGGLFFMVIIVLFFSLGFQDTPDYSNYFNDWLGEKSVLNIFSDPLARIYYSLFYKDLISSAIAICLPLLFFLYLSARLRFLQSLLVLSMYPVIFGSIINPRFFFAVTIFSYSLIYLSSSFFIISVLMLIVALTLHLGVGLLIPLYFALFLRGRGKISFAVSLIFVISLVLTNSFSNLDFFSGLDYRLEYALDGASVNKMNFIHTYFFLTLAFWMGSRSFDNKSSDFQILFFVVLFGLAFCLSSIFFYNLMISRILHGLSFIAVIFAFRVTEFKFGKSYILFFASIPISLSFTYPGFYFSGYWIFGIILGITMFLVIIYLCFFGVTTIKFKV